LEVLLVEDLAFVWKAVSDVSRSTDEVDGFDNLQQNIAALLAAEGTQLVNALLEQGDSSIELRIAVALVLSLAIAFGPGESSDPTPSLLELLPPSALSALEQSFLRLGAKSICDCPESLAAVSRTVNLALASLNDELIDKASPVDASAANEEHARKRRRIGDNGAALVDVAAMDIDVLPSAAARRTRRPPTELVSRLMEAAKARVTESAGPDAAKVFNFAGEAAEKTAIRLISSLHDSTPAVAVDMVRTIGHLSCAQSGCLDFSSCADSADAPLAPSCVLCDPLGTPFDASDNPHEHRSFTREPLEAFAEVAPAILAAANKDDKLRLAVLNAANRLLRHTAVEHAALSGENDELMLAVWGELGGASRSGRMAAG
jgi:hypothetical protein